MIILSVRVNFAGSNILAFYGRRNVSGAGWGKGARGGADERCLVTLGNQIERLTRQKILAGWWLNSAIHKLGLSSSCDVRLMETSHLVGFSFFLIPRLTG